MKKSFMTRILATGLSLAMAFSMAAATNVTTASAASKPAMITSAGASAKSLSLKVGEVTKIKVNAATKANYKVSAVKASSKRVRAAVIGSTVVAIRGLKATVEGKPSTVKVSFKSRKTNKTSKFTYSAKVTVIEDKLTIAGVTATNGTTLTVTGTKLGDLVAADITVAGNLVSSYTAAEDGKTATVKLATSLVPDEDTKVTIKGVDYTVKYSIAADTVAIQDAVIDDNTSYQYLSLTANGAASSVGDLTANGYTVRFESYKADGMQPYKLLDKNDDPDSNPTGDVETFNKTGLISNDSTNHIELGTYKVCVILTKGTSMIKSEYATITVVDQDTLTSAINSVEGYLGASRAAANYIISSKGDITLVNGEVLNIDIAEYVNDGKTYTIKNNFTTANTSLASSNKSVASVTLADNQIKITASAVGTSTVNITFGKVSKAFNVKVVSAGRYAKNIVAKDAPTSLVKGLTNVAYKYYVVDNHGAYVYNKNVVAEVSSGSSKISITTPYDDSDNAGIVQFDVNALNAGSAVISLYFGNGSNVKTGSLIRQTTITVVTTDNQTTGFKAVTIDKEGYVQKDTITTLDLNPLVARSKAMILQFTKYANGVVSGPATTASDDVIKFDERLVKVYAHTTKPATDLPANLTPTDAGSEVVHSGDTVNAQTYFTVVAKKAVDGTPSTRIAIWNKDNTVEKAYATVTVTNTTPYITGGTLKTTSVGNTNMELNLDNILNIAPDNSVSGLNITNAPAGLKLYIDKDNGRLYYNNSGAADVVARSLTVGYVYAAKNSGSFSDAGLSTVNGLKILKTGSTVNVTGADQGIINIYVDNTTAGSTTSVNANSVCIGSITVD